MLDACVFHDSCEYEKLVFGVGEIALVGGVGQSSMLIGCVGESRLSESLLSARMCVTMALRVGFGVRSFKGIGIEVSTAVLGLLLAVE